MSNEQGTSRLLSESVTRRSILGGIGTGALGLAGAALLGCSSGDKGGPAAGGGAASSSTKADSGLTGLTMEAPVVQGKPRQGGEFTDAIGATYVTNDIGVAVNVSIWHIIGERSVEWNPRTGDILPGAVQSWEVVDPLTIILKLNRNLYIHNKPPWNGRQFTAEDLAWNLERNAGFYAERLGIPKALFVRSTFFINMVKAEAIDPLTVRVKFSAPNSGFFGAGLGHSRHVLMPREMDDIGYQDPLKMAGMGPWQVHEWVKDTRSVYKKFDGYTKFRANEPYFDTYRQLAIPDLGSQQAAFISGQTQRYSPGPKDIGLIQKTKPDANLYRYTSNGFYFVRPGMRYVPFRDFRVRKAMHLALDYAALAETTYGPGWTYQAAINPALAVAWRPDKVKALPGWNPDTKAQDRAEAAKLLAAAGYPGGKGIDFGIIYYGAGGALEEGPLRFQGQMAIQFPDMKIKLDAQPDNATFGKRTNTGDFDVLSYGHDQTHDPMQAAYAETHSTGGRNEGRFSDPNADRLLEKTVSELNKDALNQLLEEYQQKWVTDWHPNWILSAIPNNTFVQSNVGGYDTIAGPLFGASYATQTKVGRLFYVDK